MGSDRRRGIALLGLAGVLVTVALWSPVTASVTKPKVKKIANKVFEKRASELQVACPAGTSPSGGVCIEGSARPDENWFIASETCGAAGRRLPLATELWAYQRAGGDLAGDGTSGEGVADVTLSGSNADWWTIRDDDQFFPSGINVEHPYRCVALPTN
jgi:hypothetical protein